MENKTYFRIIAKEKRKNLDIKTISHRLCQKLRECDFYKNATNIMLFYPMKHEINTLELLNDDKNFYLPKVVGQDLTVCPYSEEMTLSKFNVHEPCTNPVSAEILDLIIVPALMTDAKNYRLGYGGGFYDRFLAAHPNIPTVGLIAEQLFVEELPHEVHDIPLDYVIKSSC